MLSKTNSSHLLTNCILYEEKNCVQLYKRTSRFRKLARPELATSTATHTKQSNR